MTINPKHQETWTQVLSLLEKGLKKPTYETWIRPSKLVSIDNGLATIAVKNEFSRNFLAQSYIETIKKALNEVLAMSLSLRIVVDTELVFDEIENEEPQQASLAILSEKNDVLHDRQLNLNKYKSNLIDKFIFDEFLVNNSNEFSFNVSKAVASSKATDFNPLFLWSESGMGKTHLLNAIGNEYIKETNKEVRYLSGEAFTNELVSSIRGNRTNEFRKKYRDLDLLLIDDVQFFEGKSNTQEEFFHTFNSIVDSGGQVVVTANKPAQELIFDPKLKTRLNSGVVTEIETPSAEAKIKILEKKAGAEDLELDIAVLEVIARKYSNVRELEGALLRLNAYKSYSSSVIDEEAVSKLFGSFSSAGTYQGLSVKEINARVAKYFGLSQEDLIGKRRVADLARARHIAIYLTHELLGISYPRIGEFFSGRKHSSIIHSVNTVKSELLKDRSLSLIIDDIKDSLKKS